MNFKDYLTFYRDVVDKEVEGWFYPIDIVMIYGLLTHTQTFEGDICEIGVAYGKSAICISQFKKSNENFYLYDIFKEEIKNKAESNISKFGTNKKLNWRIQDTTSLTYDDIEFERPLRVLHIDGCHEHFAVLNDLQLFSGKMMDRGVIVVDDFNDYEYPGVNSAAIEFSLSKYNIKNWRVFAIGDNKAYMCQKRFLNEYQNSMISFFVKAKQDYNVPFPLPMGVREMLDVNVLMCDTRHGIEPDVLRIKLTEKPKVE
jgi:hypothetical protein